MGLNISALAALALGSTARGEDGPDLNVARGSLARILDGEPIGVGFITRMDGKSYVVTAATTVSGHNQLTFKTLSGQEIAPRKIELSATRGLVRFLIPDTSRLPLAKPAVNDAVLVPLFEAGGLKPSEGEITALSTDMIELSAKFGAKSRGAPVMKPDFSVVGVADHLVYYKAKDDTWEGTPRSFAYKLGDAKWYGVNWKRYNSMHGRNLREADEFRSTVYTIGAEWAQNPRRAIEAEADVGLDFDRWIKRHNDFVSDLGRKVSSKSREEAIHKLQIRFKESCDDLVRICVDKADRLWFLASDKKTPKYLRLQFKWRSLELKKFGGFVLTHAKRHERDSWV